MANKNNSNKNNLSAIEIFYEEIKNKVENLIIPQKYYEILEYLLSNVRFEIYYFKDNMDIESLSRENLLDKIFHSKKIDYSALHLYFERYSQDFNEDDFDFFENLLTNRKIRNYDKELIFQMFVNKKIKCNLKFFNNNLKEEFIVDSFVTKTYHSIDLYQSTELLITEMADKEISLLNFCEEILFLIYKYYFPLIPSFDYKNLAHSIFSYMLSSLQGEKIEPNEITKIIEKIISDSQEFKKIN